MEEKIVILGAGFAGMTLAQELNIKGISCTIIEESETFFMGLSLGWLLQKTMDENQISKNYLYLNSRVDKENQTSKVEWIKDSITEVKFEDKKVLLKSGIEVEYTRLVVALGINYFYKGFLEHLGDEAYNICSVEDNKELSKKLDTIENGTIVLCITKLPFKCPPAPYEWACMVDAILRERGVRENVKIQFYTPEPHPLALSKEVGKVQIAKFLKDRNIEFFSQHQISEVIPSEKKLLFKNGTEVKYDLFIASFPQKAPACLQNLVDQSGFIPTDLKTLKTKKEGIYAIGDCAHIPLPNSEKFYPTAMFHPKAGLFAKTQAIYLSEILQAIAKGEPIPETGPVSKAYCAFKTDKKNAWRLTIDLNYGNEPSFKLDGPNEVEYKFLQDFWYENMSYWFQDVKPLH